MLDLLSFWIGVFWVDWWVIVSYCNGGDFCVCKRVCDWGWLVVVCWIVVGMLFRGFVDFSYVVVSV